MRQSLATFAVFAEHAAESSTESIGAQGFWHSGAKVNTFACAGSATEESRTVVSFIPRLAGGSVLDTYEDLPLAVVTPVPHLRREA